jgi:hypothetical protein
VVLTEVRQEFLPNGKKSYRFSSQKGNFPYIGKGRVFDQNSMKNIISFLGQFFIEPINFVVLTEVRQKFLPNGKKSYRFSSQKGNFPYIDKRKGFDQNSMKNIISFFGQFFLEAINFVVLTEVRQKFLPNGKKSYRFISL